MHADLQLLPLLYSGSTTAHAVMMVLLLYQNPPHWVVSWLLHVYLILIKITVVKLGVVPLCIA